MNNRTDGLLQKVWMNRNKTIIESHMRETSFAAYLDSDGTMWLCLMGVVSPESD